MDSRIVALLQKRDERALYEIQEEYGRLCYKMAYNILGNREDADECINDMLLAIWNSTTILDPNGLRAYLVALTRHIAMDKVKTQNRQKRGGSQLTLVLDELAEILPSHDTVEQQVDVHELTEIITKWIRELSPEVQRVFVLRYFMSESIQSIARKSDMSESAVKMILHRTRKKLKKYLKKENLL